ncbi:MAG: glycosyltransferase [Clostridiales bacterium]|nr:glycosyltransferase [Clostridiales bacterium]
MAVGEEKNNSWAKLYQPLFAFGNISRVFVEEGTGKEWGAALTAHSQKNQIEVTVGSLDLEKEGFLQGSFPWEAYILSFHCLIKKPWLLTRLVEELQPCGLIIVENISSEEAWLSFETQELENTLSVQRYFFPWEEGSGILLLPEQQEENKALSAFLQGMVMGERLFALNEEKKKPLLGAQEESKDKGEKERDYFIKRIENLTLQLNNTTKEVETLYRSARFQMGSAIAEAFTSPGDFFKTPKKIYRLLKGKKEGDRQQHLLPQAAPKEEEPFAKALYTKEQLKEKNQALLAKTENSFPEKEKDPSLRVSVIVVNHNGLDNLKLLFSSLEENKGTLPYELIVVDNHSSDGSLAFIKAWQGRVKVSCIENQSNLSFSAANNQGAKAAKGAYLVFLNNDIEVTQGWLEALLSVAEKKGTGAVGGTLIYPDIPKGSINEGKSYLLQHTGIDFRPDVVEGRPFLRPYNMENGKQPFSSIDSKDVRPIKRLAVTAAMMMVKKELFEKVAGFDEGYLYGYEDVDLCLKLHRLGYSNYYCPTAMAFHYEFGTQNTSTNKAVVKRRKQNMALFEKKWQKYLEKERLHFALRQLPTRTYSPTIAFAVSDSNPNTMAGDYFTAKELAQALEKQGCKTVFVQRRGNQWYTLPPETDILIAMIHEYDLTKIQGIKPELTIAWMRNWFEGWCENPSIEGFDIHLATSPSAATYVENRIVKPVGLLPIATNAETFAQVPFLPENPIDRKNYQADYIFTGSYWNRQRELIDFLHPENLPYKGHIYGENWEKVPTLAPLAKGGKPYEEMPTLYQYTTLVLDDANSKTKELGAVNSRVFDGLAAGRLVLTNGLVGAKETFQGKLPTYSTAKELEEQISYYMEHPEKREEIVKELREEVLAHHTYAHRATALLQFCIDYFTKDPEKIAILIAAPNVRELHQWGDYHFAKGLEKAFGKKGYQCDIRALPQWEEPFDGKYVLVLRGKSPYLPKKEHITLLWNISHPDGIALEEYALYDGVCIASTYWTEEINKSLFPPAKTLLQCTDEEVFFTPYQEEKSLDLLFVGNARKVHRKIMKDLFPTPYQVKIYGQGWEELVEKNYIGGEYIPNEELAQAYQSCKILLNDHWKDMKEQGFISNRLFDGLAAGACILSDDVVGLEEVLPAMVITYNGSKKDLKEKIDRYINDPEGRKQMALHGQQEVVSKHTFAKRGETLLALFHSLHYPS